jgi:hypothetical protein
METTISRSYKTAFVIDEANLLKFEGLFQNILTKANQDLEAQFKDSPEDSRNATIDKLKKNANI